jgi:hypothetical protein
VSEPLSFGTRIWFAWLCFFRVLFDGAFAGEVWAARERGAGQLPPAPEPQKKAEQKKAPEKPAPAMPVAPEPDAALQLLALFQREGRLIDFLEQDITSFPDADVGAAARVVHEGCRKALRAHATIVAVRTEDEGARVTLQAGFDATEVKLSGNVAGNGPFAGVLRHRGWRATAIALPVPVKGHDSHVLAPAEVEL